MPVTTVYIYSQSEDDIIHWGRMAGLHKSSRQLCIIEFVDLTVFCTNKELKRKEKHVYKRTLHFIQLQHFCLQTSAWKFRDNTTHSNVHIQVEVCGHLKTGHNKKQEVMQTKVYLARKQLKTIEMGRKGPGQKTDCFTRHTLLSLSPHFWNYTLHNST